MKLRTFSSVAYLFSYVNLLLANKQPHLSWDKRTIKDCSFWYDNTGSRTCESIRKAWQVSPETFSRWNPSITLDCDGWRFQSYCVRVKAEETTPSSTPTRTRSSIISTTTETAPPLWTDVGCYHDASIHPLQTQLPGPGGAGFMSRSKCEDSCWKAGYVFAGLKAGVECWCGNYVQGNFTPSPSDCNIPCAGNSSEICGGITVFNVVQGREPPYTHTITLAESSTSSYSSLSTSSSSSSVPSTHTTTAVTSTDNPTSSFVPGSSSTSASASTRISIPLPIKLLAGMLWSCYNGSTSIMMITLGL